MIFDEPIEFKKRFFIRIITLILLFPLIIIFFWLDLIFTKCIGVIFLIGLGVIWSNDFSYRVKIYKDKLVNHKLFTRKEILFDLKTEFYHSIIQQKFCGFNVGKLNFITIKHGNNFIKLDNNLKNIENFKIIVFNIESEIFTKKLEQVVRYQESLKFGPLLITKNFINYNNKAIYYNEIKRWYLENGFLMIKKTENILEGVRIPISNIPNMASFLKLLDHYMQQKLG